MGHPNRIDYALGLAPFDSRMPIFSRNIFSLMQQNYRNRIFCDQVEKAWSIFSRLRPHVRRGATRPVRRGATLSHLYRKRPF